VCFLILTKVASKIEIITTKSGMNKKQTGNLNRLFGWIVIIAGIIWYLKI